MVIIILFRYFNASFAQDRELMNTAVLTGRQVYKAMKVFIVSQSGKVADITLQSSCHSEDESVIKVNFAWLHKYFLRSSVSIVNNSWMSVNIRMGQMNESRWECVPYI